MRSDYRPSLEPRADEPVFLAIARAVQDDVRTGRLKPGERLPGSRALAEATGVHRSTVVAALRELRAQGWVVARIGSGTFVPLDLPPGAVGVPERRDPNLVGFPLPRAPVSPLDPRPPHGALVLYGGHPELRDWPIAELARAYRRALEQRGTTLLDYGDPRGERRLRGALARLVTERRGVVAEPEDVLITRGSQMALDLTSRALLRPGDVVAVEAFGYRPAWRALAGAGARLVPVPVDHDGMDVDALRRLAAVEQVRAVYVTPHHQYPTGAVLSASRRLALLELAREREVLVIEDDYDNEFHYDGRPVLPLASMDRHGVVIYVGTLSKALAPGLRTGFVVAPRPVLEHLVALRTRTDRQGDQVLERALADLIEDGTVQRHIRKRQRLYHHRRGVLCSALVEHLGDVIDVEPPPGGLALWCPIRADLDGDAWVERGRQAGVYCTTGTPYAFDGRPQATLRVGFARCNDEELREAVRRLAGAR